MAKWRGRCPADAWGKAKGLRRRGRSPELAGACGGPSPGGVAGGTGQSLQSKAEQGERASLCRVVPAHTLRRDLARLRCWCYTLWCSTQVCQEQRWGRKICDAALAGQARNTTLCELASGGGAVFVRPTPAVRLLSARRRSSPRGHRSKHQTPNPCPLDAYLRAEVMANQNIGMCSRRCRCGIPIVGLGRRRP